MNANVFDEWIVDTDETYKELVDFDEFWWKVNRFVKDPEDYANIKNLLVKHMKILKLIYTTLIACSDFPNISWLDFAQFIKECDILDKNLNLSAVDRLFIAANVEVED